MGGYAASSSFHSNRTIWTLLRRASIVKPISARSQSDPQYVIFSEPDGERRQSYGIPQC